MQSLQYRPLYSDPHNDKTLRFYDRHLDSFNSSLRRKTNSQRRRKKINELSFLFLSSSAFYFSAF